MRVLIVQLSDIHIKGISDLVLSRATRIADAVRDLDHELDAVVIALTGDVAFSGQQAQYAIAEKWLTEVRDALARAFGPKLPSLTAVIPGNHDCDFSHPQPTRDLILNAMTGNASLASDPSSVAACVAVQQHFFAFRDKVSASHLKASSVLYWEYSLAMRSGEQLLVRCCNTSWVSRLQEQPGSLIYPEETIPEGSSKEQLVVTMLHHPYNWLAPMNARDVRRRLQLVSDVILTGHEHDFAARSQQDESGGNALYVEGVALQEQSDKLESAFHAIVVDTGKREYRLIPFRWEKDRYLEERGPATEWRAFATNLLRAGHTFQLSEASRRYLNDPGITLLHPTRGALPLDAIFVYPDLREVTPEIGTRATTKYLRGENLFASIAVGEGALITGTPECGKTTLAKRLFLDALDAGFVPVMLDGASARLRGDERDRKVYAAAFEDQYAAGGEGYLNLPYEQRVIIVDNYSRLGLPKAHLHRTLAYMRHFAGKVFLLASEFAQQVEDVVGLATMAEGGAKFEQYSLLPMSHVRREEMISRYVGLAAIEDQQKAEILRAEMRKLLDTALGKYLAPAVPVAIISILQARAFQEQLNLSQSTYGYYYELLIKRQLLANTTHRELDVRLAYLTSLAYAVFESGSNSWDEAWFVHFHQRFSADKKLQLGFRSTVQTLLDAGIIETRDDAFFFRYPYIYFYFAGRALAERLHTDGGKAHVTALARRLDEERSANILLFLTHHTKDDQVISAMLGQAAQAFGEAEPARLDADLEAFDVFDALIRNAVYQDRPIADSRRDYLSKLDDAERAASQSTGEHPALASSDTEKRSSDDEELRSAEQFVARLYSGMRSIQILGQLLKNFPGSLDGTQKDAIARSAYGVGLRMLGAVHDLVRERPEEMAAQVVGALRKEYPHASEGELQLRARNAIYFYVYVSAFSIIQRIANDVGAPHLEQVYSEIEHSDPAPSVRLISAALELDRGGSFPEARVEQLSVEFTKNPLAKRVLQTLVVTHFHLFDVPYDVKQRVCSVLGIRYKASLPKVDAKTRRLGSG